MTLQEHLNQQIAEAYDLLREYEEKENLTSDPRKRRRYQSEIERQRETIRKLEADRDRLPADAGVLFYKNSPYGLEKGFTGRQKELETLTDWLTNDPDCPLLALIALGGTGKSALVWHWQLALRQQANPPIQRVIWWGFYETASDVRQFLSDALVFFGDQPPPQDNPRQQLNRLSDRLRTSPTLLLLDGAERLLRAYRGLNAPYLGDDGADNAADDNLNARDCVDPIAEALLRELAQHPTSKTILTSRMLPRALQGRGKEMVSGARQIELTGLSLAETQELFRQAGVQASRAEVQAVGEPLGYHPLSLRLLAQVAASDPQYQDDIRAAVNYDPYPELLGKRQHVLHCAYDCLPDTAQQVLSRLAAFRGGVDWETAAAVMGDSDQLRRDLRRLEERGLLQCATQTGVARYDLHPIVRRYAYDRLLNGAEIHSQLVNYFEAVPQPTKVQTLADLQPVIEQYHHLTCCGRYDAAWILYRDRLWTPIYYQLGYYQIQIECLHALFVDGTTALPHLAEETHQAHACNELANSYSLAGRPAAAVPLFERVNDIYANKMGNKTFLAIGLGNLASMVQIHIGQLTAAANNLRRSIELGEEIEDRRNEAIGRQEYGRLLALCGNGIGAAQELERALELFTAERDIQSQGIVWASRAQAALLQGDGRTAQTAAQEALRLADEDARTRYPHERDYVRVYWLLGWAALLNGNLANAQSYLDEALRRCRAINMVDHEPAILLAQARLARAVGQEASLPANLVAEARLIAERSGYRLDLADIHNFLAQLALDKGDKAAARAHAYALCDGPPYAYQSALDEATRLREEAK